MSRGGPWTPISGERDGAERSYRLRRVHALLREHRTVRDGLVPCPQCGGRDPLTGPHDDVCGCGTEWVDGRPAGDGLRRGRVPRWDA